MQPSLYAQYVSERLGKDVLENEHGFCTCIVMNDRFYLEEIFVRKESRRAGHAQKLADEAVAWAKRMGYKKVIGSVNLKARGYLYSMKLLEIYGFKLFEANQNMLFFEKDI